MLAAILTAAIAQSRSETPFGRSEAKIPLISDPAYAVGKPKVGNEVKEISVANRGVPARVEKKPDPRYMQRADYLAASLGASKGPNFSPEDKALEPVPLTCPELMGKPLSAHLERRKGEFVVCFGADAGEPLTFTCAGGIPGYLEAKVGKQPWRPIEYHRWETCGNAYRDVAIQPGYQWMWRTPVPEGTVAAKVRWKVFRNDGLFYVSNEVAARIPAQRFQLEPKLAKDWMIHPEWPGAVLVPKGQVEWEKRRDEEERKDSLKKAFPRSLPVVPPGL